MDFFDPKKKRARTTRLYLGYVLMGVALIIGTLIVWYQTYGYDIDRRTGDVIQKGLVFVDAHPESAVIYLNGEDKGRTDARFTQAAGHYSLELKRDGYRAWKHEFDLYGGAIERFVYPFLFPEKLSVSEKKSYGAAPPLATVSLDRRWLVIQQPGDFMTFDVVDLTAPKAQIQTITIPAGVLTVSNEAQNLEFVEWSSNNRHVLLKHTFGAVVEYITLDRVSPENSVNVTKAFNLPGARISFRDKKPDQFYLYTPEGGVLQAGDLKSRTPLPVLSRVTAFKSHGSDKLIYVTDAGASAGKVRVRIRDGDKDYTLKELPAGGTYLLALARFDGRWYMAAGMAAEGKVSVYRDPVSVMRETPEKAAIPISTLRVANPEELSFSTNARFIMAQGGSNFAVYDAERDKQYRYDIGLPLASGQKATWMDGHRLSLVSENKVAVFDFDGANKQILSAALPAYQVFFDRDYEAIYTFAPNQTGATALTRAELIIK